MSDSRIIKKKVLRAHFFPIAHLPLS